MVEKKKTRKPKAKKGQKSKGKKASTGQKQKQKQVVNVKVDLSKRTINRRPYLSQPRNNPAPLVIQSGERSGANGYLMNLMNIQQQQLREMNNNLVAYRQREQAGVGVMNPRSPVPNINFNPEPVVGIPLRESLGGAEEPSTPEPIQQAQPAVGTNTKADLIRRITGASTIPPEELQGLTINQLRQKAVEVGVIKPRQVRNRTGNLDEAFKLGETVGASEMMDVVGRQRQKEELGGRTLLQRQFRKGKE